MNIRLLLPLLVACRPAVVPEEWPDPWEGQSTLPLEFRWMAEEKLEMHGAPERVEVLSSRSLTFVLDPEGRRVHVVDPSFRHSGAVHCLDSSFWPGVEAGPARQGVCQEGFVEIHRGYVETQGTPVGMAVDSEDLDLYVLDHLGTLFRVSADLVRGNPYDYLKAVEQVKLPLELQPRVHPTAFFEGVFYVAEGSRIWAFEPGGLLVGSQDQAATVVDMVVSGERLWVATEEGLGWNETWWPLDSTPSRMRADGQGGVWISLPEEGALVHVLDEESAVAVEGLQGPLAVDPVGRVYAAVDGGLALVDEAGEWARVETEGLRDLAANSAHEVILLGEAGDLVLYLDETSLGSGSPLSFLLTTFSEQPRSPAEDVPCEGESNSMVGILERSVENRALLADLPADISLGITPHFARRVGICELQEGYAEVWDTERTEVGLLYHQLPSDSCLADADCYSKYLQDQASTLAGIQARPTWVSGLSAHGDVVEDWVEILLETELPRTYLFFGLSLLPEISHDLDIRAKEPYPVDLPDRSTPWAASQMADLAGGGVEGGLALYPGDSRAAFSLDGCAGLFVRECRALGEGGGETLGEGDIGVLDLLLHRSLAMRPVEGPSTFSFHLPDIGVWDYTEGCEVEARHWQGEDCMAQVLQTWLVEVQRRFVQNGLVEWTLPSELDSPG